MAQNIQKLNGTSLNTFTIGLKSNLSTFTVNGTTIAIDKQLDMSSHKIINLTDPSNNQDAMTKKYADDNYINLTEKGAANGVATLVGGKIPVSQLPNSVMEFQGAWNALTNSPTLADGTGNAGDVYRVSVEGTQNLGSGAVTFYVGDFVIYSGSVWQRSPMADGVQSVFGRTGVVTAANGDYTASQITNVPAGNVAAITVQAAINELDTEKMALTASPTAGHVLTTDAAGQAVDSGTALTTLTGKMDKAASPTAGHVLTTDATGQATDSGTALTTLTSKMDLIASPTAGNIVTTNASGQTVDSGKSFTTTVNGSSTANEVPTALAVYTAISGAVAPGTVQTIKIPVTTTSAASTYALPNGSVIESVSLRVGTAYSTGGTIAISCGAVSLLSTSDNDPETLGSYSNIDQVDISTGAVITVTVGGTPSLGASTVFVNFVASPIA